MSMLWNEWCHLFEEYTCPLDDTLFPLAGTQGMPVIPVECAKYTANGKIIQFAALYAIACSYKKT